MAKAGSARDAASDAENSAPDNDLRILGHAIRVLASRPIVPGTALPGTSIDVTSADAVADLAQTLRAAGVTLCFAELKGPVKDKFRRFGLIDLLGEAALYRTVEAAVRSYQAQHAVGWRAPDAAVDPLLDAQGQMAADFFVEIAFVRSHGSILIHRNPPMPHS